MKIGLAVLLLAAFCLPWSAGASPRFQHRVDPRVRIWFDGPLLAHLARPDRVPAGRPREAPVSIRFSRPPPVSLLRRLERAGVRFLRGRHGERYLQLVSIYPARVTMGGLAALSRCELVRQVELDTLLNRTLPLDLTAQLVGAPQVWPRLVKGVSLTGKGMVVGNIDGGIDVFHPALFRADGGLRAWIDSDGNGSFDAGTDAVDLNQNGKADSGETLDFFDAVSVSPSGHPILGSSNGVFDPDLDWLFADTNGNGQRDHGAPAFGDTTPTYGEPLLLAEDLNGNRKLDPEEKLLLLGTSKVKATNHDGREWTRGKDLTLTYKGASVSHGIATAGVLVGGIRGRQRRVGMVPDAELMVGIHGKALTPLLIWLTKGGANVILHEYAPWTGYHMDGSSNHEQLMDSAAKLGVPQVTPAGNLGGAHKAMRLTINSGQTIKVPLEVPTSTSSKKFYYAAISFLWRDTAANLEFSLQDPNGKANVLGSSSTTSKDWGDGKTTYYSYRWDSTRGTALLHSYLVAGTSGAYKELTSGSWTLTVKNPKSAKPVILLGYVYDVTSSWSKGIAFGKYVSEQNLICWPATADSAITLGAYAGHVGSPYEYTITGDKSGDLRRYSGRGARVDGVSIMDITAPDNPVTTYHQGHGSYRVFGGTSGAGPHVAGAAVLLKQLNPKLDGIAVRAALRTSAAADAQTGAVPSDSWGYGKLRIYQALYGKDPVANTAPTVSVKVTGKLWVGSTVTLTPTATDAEDTAGKLQLRWDDGYDGTWDGAAGPVAPRSVTLARVGEQRFKLRVFDSGGLYGEAAVLLRVLPAGTQPDRGAPDGDAALVDAGGDQARDAGEASEEQDGCGCKVAVGARGAGGLLALLLWGLWLASRRRRARNGRPRFGDHALVGWGSAPPANSGGAEPHPTPDRYRIVTSGLEVHLATHTIRGKP